jgi:hypothetical protein
MDQAMGNENPGRAALTYLTRGWAAIPIEPGGKRPLVRWEPYQREPPSEPEIEHWFRQWPEANVGIVTGAVSGLVVLDVDPRHGGEESLRDLERRFGPLSETLEAQTGGGGRHLYFAHPGGELRNRVGLAPGLDLRGDGGLVVAPPSLHPSGRRYAWTQDPDALPPAPLPPWLEALARDQTGRSGHPAQYWGALITEGVDEGRRNDTIASLTGHLLWHGVDPEVARELLRCWNQVRCRPPLDEAEVLRTVESITRTHFRHHGGRGEA